MNRAGRLTDSRLAGVIRFGGRTRDRFPPHGSWASSTAVFGADQVSAEREGRRRALESDAAHGPTPTARESVTESRPSASDLPLHGNLSTDLP